MIKYIQFLILLLCLNGCQNRNIEGLWIYEDETINYETSLFNKTTYPVVNIDKNKMDFIHGAYRIDSLAYDYNLHFNKLEIHDEKYKLKNIDEKSFYLISAIDSFRFKKIDITDDYFPIEYFTVNYGMIGYGDTTKVAIKKNNTVLLESGNIRLEKQTDETFIAYTNYLLNKIPENLLDSTYLSPSTTHSHYSEHHITIKAKDKNIRISTFSGTSKRVPEPIRDLIRNLLNYWILRATSSL